MNQEIIDAIENQNVIEFNYDGELRVVEPHCYGKTTAGNEGLRAYQIDGFSSSGKMGWKMYDLGKADDIDVSDEHFSTRNDYKRGDKGMSEIYAEI
ncbi:conserved hypothetical protein [Flavobacterium psychrophilum]|uniref:hypothetical protein n=1 Tax=Flavobacterium psychrophilum TaxID=96345 RepID=UPI000B7C0DCF|nr:hypothetical protein [Flavobacterium psychrophilum]SNB26167.1 conserved hypothetical protein [Flavobacterium psychrophilum]